jgi:P27 family predicted phage terminase small subunit
MPGVKGMRGGGKKMDPPALRVLKSKDGKHDASWRKIEAAPPFQRYCPAKPDDLSPEASRHWDEITPELIRADLLTAHNVGGLVILCETWARWKIAQRQLAESDWELVTLNGHKNPLATILVETGNQYRSFATEFGLTPSSETKLGSKDLEPPGKNPFAEGSTSI